MKDFDTVVPYSEWMLKFEAVKLDPSPGDVVEMLTEAAGVANKRCRTRLIEDDPAKWRKGANLFQASAEGWEFWRGGRGAVPATQVMLSWWTDPLGRKHCVVRGRRCEFDGAKVFLDRSILETRPALWHCYPARIFFRNDSTTHGWIVVCGCGAIGAPESLGWMGDTCGPCHDLREERGEEALRDHRIGILSGPRAQPTRVAISPDGSTVALSDQSGKFHVWTLGDESRHEFKAQLGVRETDYYAQPDFGSTLAFTGDSKTLINDYHILGEQIVGLDCTTDPPTVIPLTAPAHAPNVIIPWAGNTFCRVWSDHLEWVDATTREPVRELKVPLGNVWQAIPSHDYSRLFVRVGNRCTIIDPDDGQILIRPDLSDNEGMLYRENVPVHCVFSKDYRRVVIAYHMYLHVIDGVSGRTLIKKIDRRDPFDKASGVDVPDGLAIDPTDSVLIVSGMLSKITFYTLEELKPLARFTWHLQAHRGFSGTPDGLHYVTAGMEGQVKYWPIDRLLTTVKPG